MSIASHFVPPVCLDSSEDELVIRVKCREPGWKGKGKHRPVPKKKKKTTRKEAEGRRTSAVPEGTVISREKSTQWASSSNCFRGPSSVAVCYGFLALLLIGQASALSQRGPIAKVLIQPATVCDRYVIECRVEPAPERCLSMYWVLNGRDLHSGKGYHFTFIDQYCLGYLTLYNVCTDTEIKCLVELVTVTLNSSSSNHSSEPVAIILPDLNNGLCPSTCEETEELHTTELMDNDVFGGEPESDFNDTRRNNTLDTDTPTVTGDSNGQEKNRESMDSNLAYISVVTIAFPIFFGTMLLICCCMKNGCQCYRKRTTQQSVRSSKFSVQNTDKQSKSEETEHTEGVQETYQNVHKFEAPKDQTSTTTGDLTTKKKDHSVWREQIGPAQLRTDEGKEDEKFAFSHDASSYMQPVPQLLQEVQLNPDQFEVEVPLEEIRLASNFDHVATIEINSPLQNNTANDFRALVEPVY